MQTSVLLKTMVCCVVIASSTILDAQSQQAANQRNKVPGRIATKVALRNELYRGEAIVVMRRPKNNGGDVIVLSGPNITAQRFAAAAVALTALREDMGDEVSKPFMLTIPESAGGSETDIRAAEKGLQTLRSGPVEYLADLGNVRTMTIYLPSQSGRDAMKRTGKADFSRRAGSR